MLDQVFPNSRLKGEANLVIMPTLDAANISFNLLKAASGGGITVGPILLGAAKPVHILTPKATVRRLVSMTALAVASMPRLLQKSQRKPESILKGNTWPRRSCTSRCICRSSPRSSSASCSGYFYPQTGAAMKPLGDGFIKLIKMIIAPIIFCTVVVGIAGMEDMKKVGKTGGLALLYFEVVSSIALVIGLTIVNLVQPGAGMNVDPRCAGYQRRRGLRGPGQDANHDRVPARG